MLFQNMKNTLDLDTRGQTCFVCSGGSFLNLKLLIIMPALSVESFVCQMGASKLILQLQWVFFFSSNVIICL